MIRRPNPEKELTDVPDLTLVAEFQRGNSAAFSEIDRRFRPRLLRFLTLRVSAPELAEELTQETLVRAFTSLPTLRDGVFLAGWLKRIAYNVYIDRLRRKAKEKTNVVYDESNREEDREERGRSLLSVSSGKLLRPSGELFFRDLKLRDFEVQDECANLWRVARDNLTPVEFQVLWLRYEDELDDKEIAKSLGKSNGSVRTALSRARSKLAIILKDSDDRL